jgi:hypothetical protein
MRFYEIEPKVWINLDLVTRIEYEPKRRPTPSGGTPPEHRLTISMVGGESIELTDLGAIKDFTHAAALKKAREDPWYPPGVSPAPRRDE